MSEPVSRRKTSTYHHGDVPAAALKAGLELLEQEGPERLTLAAVAKRIGVTAAALYRHFPDRQGLLVRLAADGFTRFDAALRSSTAADPIERLGDMGAAYLAFARDNPASYTLMFGARIDPSAHPETREVSFRAFSALVEALSHPAFGIPEERRVGRAVQVWAQCHGTAALLTMGPPGITFERYVGLTMQAVFRMTGLPDPPGTVDRDVSVAGQGPRYREEG